MPERILEQRQRQMQPFYWILTFEMITLGMLTGLALALGPVVLFIQHPTFWGSIPIIFVPFGIWMFYHLFRDLKKRVWLNRHTDHYVLYRDYIQYTLWDRQTKEAETGNIPLASIKEIYYGRFLMIDSYAYKESGFTERVARHETLPVLHIVYSDGMKERMLDIPCIDYMDANKWLQELSPNDIPIWLTSVVVHSYEDEAVHLLRDDEYRARAKFDGNIERHFMSYLENRMQEEEQSRELTEEELADELEQIEEGLKYVDYLEKEKERKSALHSIGWKAWLVMPLLCLLGFLMVELAVSGAIDPENMWIPIGLFLLADTLFFLLVKRMRLLQNVILFFCTFIVMIIVDSRSSEIETDPTYLMTSGLLGTAVLNAGLVWVVYFIIKSLRKNRDSDDRPLPPPPVSGV